MQSTELEPTLEETGSQARWMVVIHDNDVTPVDVVVAILMRATRCSVEEAEIETWEAQAYKSASVHFADEATCLKIAAIIETVGVRTTVAPEWS